MVMSWLSFAFKTLAFLELSMPAHAHTCSGPTYMQDFHGYVGYWPGDLNVIISAPHGGSIRPYDIPNRQHGCYINGQCIYTHNCGTPSRSHCRAVTTKDSYTFEIANELRNQLECLFGDRSPHMIANLLHRSKLDANREIDLATLGVPKAIDAFNNYTLFVEMARATIHNYGTGKGLFVDIHGQTHPEEWVELGYRIDGDNLSSGEYSAADSSIRDLGETECGSDATCFRALISGERSLGHFIQAQGYKVVPSPNYTSPGNGGYYRGGYNTEKYGSKNYGFIDAIQIEIPRSIRWGDERMDFARKLAQAIRDFMHLHG